MTEHPFRVDFGSDPEISNFVRHCFSIAGQRGEEPPPISDEKYPEAMRITEEINKVRSNREIQTWENVLSYLSKHITLISGLFCGGTTYATNFLNKCGILAGHEQIFAYDGIFYFGSMVGTQYDVEVSGGIPPWISSIKGTPVRYLTIVRNPVSLVNSRYYFSKAPVRRPDEILGLQRDVLTQFELNMTVMKPDLIWRIESLPDQMEVLRYFGRGDIKPEELSAARKAKRNEGKKKGPPVVEFKDLIPPLKKWAEKLGYNENQTRLP